MHVYTCTCICIYDMSFNDVQHDLDYKGAETSMDECIEQFLVKHCAWGRMAAFELSRQLVHRVDYVSDSTLGHIIKRYLAESLVDSLTSDEVIHLGELVKCRREVLLNPTDASTHLVVGLSEQGRIEEVGKVNRVRFGNEYRYKPY